jgi:hypothetical protein
MAPYPTIPEIQTLFANLSNGQGPLFFDRVVPNVDWLILGHSPLSGQYTSKTDFLTKTLGLLNEKVLAAPLKMYVDNVTGGGEQDQAVVEMHEDGMCKNGEFIGILAGRGGCGRMEGC